jgi:hypothetical protein
MKKTVIFNTVDAMFNFDQKEVMKLIARKKSEYDLDEVTKLLEHISANTKDTIVIPEEPVFFDYIALDLIGVGHGSALCKTCNKTYLAGQLKSIQVGFGGSLLDIEREKIGVLKRLFAKKRKPPTMYGGKAYECPAGHNLISVIIWKTF